MYVVGLSKDQTVRLVKVHIHSQHMYSTYYK